MNAGHEQWIVKRAYDATTKNQRERKTIRRNQMAQRPTVTQMSRKFKVTHLQVLYGKLPACSWLTLNILRALDSMFFSGQTTFRDEFSWNNRTSFLCKQERLVCVRLALMYTLRSCTWRQALLFIETRLCDVLNGFQNKMQTINNDLINSCKKTCYSIGGRHGRSATYIP